MGQQIYSFNSNIKRGLKINFTSLDDRRARRKVPLNSSCLIFSIQQIGYIPDGLAFKAVMKQPFRIKNSEEEGKMKKGSKLASLFFSVYLFCERL